jgi:parvulin-like peptidyl-prolyl isomerase
MRVKLITAMVLLLFSAACSSLPGTVATVNGTEIERERFEALHPEDYELVPDETASSLLLVTIHELFYRAAEEDLGLSISAEDRESAFTNRTQPARGIGDVDEVLANRGVTAERVRLEADLDALQSVVGPHLVRAEADGFDIDAAYESYLKAEGYVCVQQMLLGDTANLEDIVDRVNGGESFGALAREFSLDNLAQRPDGESGAGGDMGCSFPNSFGLGLADAAIDESIPVGEAFGPIISDRGLHVMVVYERELPALSNVRGEVVEAAVDTQAIDVFRTWAVSVLESADVTIHEAYGSWGPAEGTNGVPTVIPADG